MEDSHTEGTSDALVGELHDPDEEPASYPLEKQRQEAGLGHITPEMRREVFNRLIEFETRLSHLTIKQQNFVLAYLADPSSGPNAARAAGYSETEINGTASKLLHSDKIAHVIALGQLLREERNNISAERTLNELAIIAYSDLTNFIVEPGTNNLKTKPGVPEYMTRAVSSAEFVTTVKSYGKEGNETTETTFKTKIKMWNKTDALRMLMLYQRLLQPDGNKVTINQTNNITKNTWQFGDKSIDI